MAFEKSIYPEKRSKPWTEHALNIGGLALAITVIIALSPYVYGALFVWTQPQPMAAPTAYVVPTQRPISKPAVDSSVPVSTLAPGLGATEADSLLIYQATAAAMDAGTTIPEGVEYGSKESVKVWPTPQPATIEVQSMPAPTEQPRFGNKPSQKKR